jgi:predicted oxidoreductase
MNMGGARGVPREEGDTRRATELVLAALEEGITLFDHADIYAGGKSEAVFGEVMREQPGLRDRMVLQSKCGIRVQGDPLEHYPARYDFSYEHIVQSVDGSLNRLKTDRLDVLLLHRPDPLVEPEEVAGAFSELQRAGKVRYFGVSNHTAPQIELLKKFLDQPLVINQLELNLLHSNLVGDGVLANQSGNEYTGAGGILDYCRLNDILVQAWAPVANGWLLDPPAGAGDRVTQTARLARELAALKHTTMEAVVLGWLLRHPAGIQPIIGSTKKERIVASCRADTVELSREEWYQLLVAARGAGMP